MVAVLSGVLRGSGRQTWGAALNLVGYWGVGCPMALLLGFWARLDVVGFWWGLATATSLQVGKRVCIWNQVEVRLGDFGSVVVGVVGILRDVHRVRAGTARRWC